MEQETLAASQKAEDEAPADVNARKASEEATAKKVAQGAAAGKAVIEASSKTAATKAAEETTVEDGAAEDVKEKEISAKKANEETGSEKSSKLVLPVVEETGEQRDAASELDVIAFVVPMHQSQGNQEGQGGHQARPTCHRGSW